MSEQFGRRRTRILAPQHGMQPLGGEMVEHDVDDGPRIEGLYWSVHLCIRRRARCTCGLNMRHVHVVWRVSCKEPPDVECRRAYVLAGEYACRLTSGGVPAAP